MERIPLFTFISVLWISISYSSAQNTILGTETELDNSKFSALNQIIKSYRIIEIDIRKKDVDLNSNSGKLNLQLGEESLKLSLFTNNVIVSTKSNNKPLLLSGSYNSNSQVSLTINDNFIYGFLRGGGSTRYIEPLWYFEPDAPKNLYVLYNTTDVIEDSNHKCGVKETESKIPQSVPQKMTTSCRIVDYAIANTADMFTKYGSTTGVMNHNLGVLNNVQTNYRSEFNSNLEYNVVANYIPTNSANDPLTPNDTNNPTTDPDSLLKYFSVWAGEINNTSFPCTFLNNAGGGAPGGNSGGFATTFDMAGFWSDRDFDGGTIGYACTPGWFHILEDNTTSAVGLNVLCSHEMGHNWGALHDAGSSNIMFPNVLATDKWNSTAVNAINSRVSSVSSSLSNCSTLGAPIANFNSMESVVCINSQVEFEDQSQYGATRMWSFPGGNPSSSTDAKPSPSYSSSGLYYVELSSFNPAASTNIAQGYVDVQSPAPNQCAPTGSNGASLGITSFALENVTNSSTASGLYEDFSCTEIAVIEADTSYSMSLGVAQTSASFLGLFCDWNGDGDFSDTNESIAFYNLPATQNVTYTLPPLMTPSSPLLSSLLRFRVILSSTQFSSPCISPNTGQVEDYSIYFPINQTFGCTDPTSNNYNPSATVDDGSCTGSTTFFVDSDGDGFGSTITASSGVTNNTDCDDNDADNYPSNVETCDGQDNNCDGLVDDADPNVTGQNTYYADSDGDGFGNAGNSISTCASTPPSGYSVYNTDCDDTDADNYPGNVEICDGQDNNCDGLVDDADPNVTGQNTYYADSDGDGFGDAGNSISRCASAPPSGYSVYDTDCDDNDADNYPGNVETCDGQDNNCDGLVDDADPNVTGQNTYYTDSDGDGFGSPTNTIQACMLPSGYSTNNLDCNDNIASINPNAMRKCDNVDNDCDGIIDFGCQDCDDTDLNINMNYNVLAVNRAEQTIDSDVLLNLNSVLYTAGNNIELLPNFEVASGKTFEARIEPCVQNFQNVEGESEKRIIYDGDIKLELIPNYFDIDEHITIQVNKRGKTKSSIFMEGENEDVYKEFLGQLSKLKTGTYNISVSSENHSFSSKLYITLIE